MGGNNYLRVITNDGRKIDLPVVRSVSQYESDPIVTFEAHQQASGAMNVTEMHLQSDSLDSPVTFPLESFLLEDGEAGRWTVTVQKDENGSHQFDLEYVITERDGERVWPPLVFSWSHDQKGMVVN